MSSPTRAPDPRPARTRAAIYTAARELSSADGEVTVNALTRRAGISRAAFYSHFSGLDELIGQMLHDMFQTVWEEGAAMHRGVASPHERVRSSTAVVVAYVEQHRAFLLGALDWKFSHRTFLALLEMVSVRHRHAFDALGEDLPAEVDRSVASDAFAGSQLSLIIRWLDRSEHVVADGGEPDAAALLESTLRCWPTWYTGLQPGDDFDARGLLEAAHRVLAEQREQAQG